MKDDIKVSVIMPIYNSEVYLKKSLESIINQSFDDKYEIILVDDGSTDRSIEMEHYYAQKYSMVKVIKQKNSGASAARNNGIKNAKGKYIFFIDSDDEADKDLLRSCYSNAEKMNLDVLFFGAEYNNITTKEHGLCINKSVEEGKIISGYEYFVNTATNNYFGCVNVWIQFIKRSYLIDNNITFFDGIINEDYKFFMDILLPAEKVMYINRIFYNYTIRDNSVSRTINSHCSESDLIIISYICEIISLNESYYKDINFIKACLQLSWPLIAGIYEGNYKYIQKVINKFITLFCNVMNEKDYFYLGLFLDRIGGNECRKELYDELIKHCNNMKIKLLLNIPFDDTNKIIGIYGLGQHTKSLLNFYNNKIGEIKCRVIYIDSYKGHNGEHFMGNSIVNIEDVNKLNLDGIVVSSATYEKQLCNNIKKYCGNSMKIYEFYRNYENIPAVIFN